MRRCAADGDWSSLLLGWWGGGGGEHAGVQLSPCSTHLCYTQHTHTAYCGACVVGYLHRSTGSVSVPAASVLDPPPCATGCLDCSGARAAFCPTTELAIATRRAARLPSPPWVPLLLASAAPLLLVGRGRRGGGGVGARAPVQSRRLSARAAAAAGAAAPWQAAARLCRSRGSRGWLSKPPRRRPPCTPRPQPEAVWHPARPESAGGREQQPRSPSGLLRGGATPPVAAGPLGYRPQDGLGPGPRMGTPIAMAWGCPARRGMTGSGARRVGSRAGAGAGAPSRAAPSRRPGPPPP